MASAYLVSVLWRAHSGRQWPTLAASGSDRRELRDEAWLSTLAARSPRTPGTARPALSAALVCRHASAT